MGTQVVELNGKKYDLKTGQLITSSIKGQPESNASASHSIDGITPESNISNLSAKKEAKKRAINVKHTGGAWQVHLRPNKSKTLMRSAVKKPSWHKAQTTKPHVELVNKERIRRALRHQRSEYISKFYDTNNTFSSTIRKQLGHIPVHSPPEDNQPTPSLDNKDPQTSEVTAKRERQTTFTMLEQAVANATSHQAEPLAAPKQKSTFGLAGAAIAVLLLAGSIAYQNTHQVSIRLAGNRAGISAQLPSYKPAGFSISNQITYSPGQVIATYQANSDDREFTLIQKKSDWNEQELVANFLDPNYASYQAYQDFGKTIYVYDKGNATWVKDGIWYQVEGDSSLSSEQLIRLAASL